MINQSGTPWESNQGDVSFSNWLHLVLVVFFHSIACSQAAGNLQLISARNPSIAAPASASGDSDLPILSADGRYALFASSAENLVTNWNNGPVSGLLPRPMNVFLRDRTTATTVLISVSPDGTAGNGDSFPSAISTDGQYALFESAASNLVSGDTNNVADVFLRDLASGVTILISTDTNGVAGNGNSRSPAMTPDARYIAFVSAASNLVAQDSNGIPDIFVRDRLASTTTPASVGATSTGSFTLPSSSESPDITPDGRFVAFFSTATNLLPGVTAAGQVFVRDLISGTTTWASTNAHALFQSVFGTTNEIACNQRISADGNYVAFEACTNSVNDSYAPGLILRYSLQSGLTDLVFTNANVPLMRFEDINTLDMTSDGRFIAFVANTNGGFGSATAIYLWDAQSGSSLLISQNLSGGVSANDSCNWPRLDGTGRFVAFTAIASNLTANVASGYNYYLRDTQAGGISLLNVDTNGAGTGANNWSPPAMSNNGQLIAFVCPDGNLVANDGNRATDVFVRDTAANMTELISVRDSTLPGTAANGSSGFSAIATSSNGLYVAFTSEANSLVGNDTNKFRDVFVRDVLNATNTLVSVNTNGVAASGISTEPSISADGRYVVFSSSANDLITGDTNKSLDVFIRDMQSGTTTLISKNIAGTGQGNGDSYFPNISSDGRYVLYQSKAQNLTSGTFSGIFGNLFLRDRQLGTNYALTFSAGVYAASMTPDGRRISFTGFIDATTAKLFVWDTQLAKRIYTNTYLFGFTDNTISPDGQRVAYLDTQIKVANLISNTITVISSGTFPPTRVTSFSNDGRFLSYTTTAANSSTDTNLARDIYLYDFQSGTNTLISRSFNSSAAANGASDWPVISRDGRFITYRSFASNHVPADFNAVPDLFLYDRSNAVTMLLSANLSGNRTANNRSLNPLFSGDSKTLYFQAGLPIYYRKISIMAATFSCFL